MHFDATMTVAVTNADTALRESRLAINAVAEFQPKCPTTKHNARQVADMA